MSRISPLFEQLRRENRTALIPYITAGDPHPDATVGIMHALVEGGADMIELGVPFSDPMADGPVIAAAHERALAHHVGLVHVLDMVKTFRETNQNTPVILMGYQNPIEAMGTDRFAQLAQEAGLDGVLTVDLPPEEADTCFQGLSCRWHRSHFPDCTYDSCRTRASHRRSGKWLCLLCFTQGCDRCQ